MSEDAGANVRVVTLIQSIRVLVLVFVLPFWIEWAGGLQICGSPAETEGIRQLSIVEGLSLLVIGLIGWFAGIKLGLSGAAIVGPMCLSAILHVLGIIEATVPREVVNLAQVFVGIHTQPQIRRWVVGVLDFQLVTAVAQPIIFDNRAM